MPDAAHSDNESVLFKALCKHTAIVRRNAHCCGVALRAFRSGSARLDDLTHVDDDPRAAYFKQAQYGVYVRMALILALLEITDPLTGEKVL